MVVLLSLFPVDVAADARVVVSVAADVAADIRDS